VRGPPAASMCTAACNTKQQQGFQRRFNRILRMRSRVSIRFQSIPREFNRVSARFE
jgi:hypothetical protein